MVRIIYLEQIHHFYRVESEHESIILPWTPQSYLILAIRTGSMIRWLERLCTCKTKRSRASESWFGRSRLGIRRLRHQIQTTPSSWHWQAYHSHFRDDGSGSSRPTNVLKELINQIISPISFISSSQDFAAESLILHCPKSVVKYLMSSHCALEKSKQGLSCLRYILSTRYSPIRFSALILAAVHLLPLGHSF
jgi:hypothetical protein